MPIAVQIHDFYEHAGEIVQNLHGGGVFCAVVDAEGRSNIVTLGWGQIGPFYHGNPVFSIAITPLRYSWRFIEAVPEFVIALPADSHSDALTLCGTRSGRDMDKFKSANLTPVPSQVVRAPSVLECPLNIECRVYAQVAPPHQLLTPEHRRRPIDEQHTIYFAEVLGCYRYQR